MSGYVGDLSPQQEAALQQFKAAVKDIPNKPDDTDYFYLRWLRARRFDLQKTELMFRNYMAYRKKFGADTILEDYTPPPMFEECLSGGYFGEDVDGHPVWYDNIGNLDPRGIHRSIRHLDEILKYKCLHHVLMDIKLKEFSKAKGKHIETTTVVIDFKNLSFQKHLYWPAVENFKEFLKVEEASNPERTKTILVVNAPSIFPFCYNIIKHVLDEKTRKKVVIFGINCNLKEEIQKYISLDQLPAMYGGNRFEPDAECSDYIRPGRDVPEKYYLTNCTYTSKEEMERVVVGRGSSHKVRHQVAEVGCTLQWEFFTTDYDIAFRVSMNKKVKDKEERQTILPSSRSDSHLFPQSGQHKCEDPGEYVFKFDNSYSWTRSKEVFFSIKVVPPNVEPEAPHAAGVSHTLEPSPSTSQNDEDEFFECSEQDNTEQVNTTEPVNTEQVNGLSSTAQQ